MEVILDILALYQISVERFQFVLTDDICCRFFINDLCYVEELYFFFKIFIFLIILKILFIFYFFETESHFVAQDGV